MSLGKSKSKGKIKVSVKPESEFSKGDVFRKKDSRDFSGSFRIKDIGKKGGLKATLGKTKTEVHLEAPGGAETSIKSYSLDKKYVGIKDKQLIGKNERGKKEINQIKRSQGSLEQIGIDHFIVKKNKKLFDRADILNRQSGGVKKANKLNKESLVILRRKSIPESIIRKMNSGRELSEFEKDVLHLKGLEYVRSNKRKSFVREYRGGTEARLKNLNLL